MNGRSKFARNFFLNPPYGMVLMQKETSPFSRVNAIFKTEEMSIIESGGKDLLSIPMSQNAVFLYFDTL